MCAISGAKGTCKRAHRRGEPCVQAVGSARRDRAGRRIVPARTRRTTRAFGRSRRGRNVRNPPRRKAGRCVGAVYGTGRASSQVGREARLPESFQLSDCGTNSALRSHNRAMAEARAKQKQPPPPAPRAKPRYNKAEPTGAYRRCVSHPTATTQRLKY
eukprot:1194893-Prorocentrum_minimum.AAC.3